LSSQKKHIPLALLSSISLDVRTLLGFEVMDPELDAALLLLAWDLVAEGLAEYLWGGADVGPPEDPL